MLPPPPAGTRGLWACRGAAIGMPHTARSTTTSIALWQVRLPVPLMAEALRRSSSRRRRQPLGDRLGHRVGASAAGLDHLVTSIIVSFAAVPVNVAIFFCRSITNVLGLTLIPESGARAEWASCELFRAFSSQVGARETKMFRIAAVCRRRCSGGRRCLLTTFASSIERQ